MEAGAELESRTSRVQPHCEEHSRAAEEEMAPVVVVVQQHSQ